MKLQTGIYEQLISEALAKELAATNYRFDAKEMDGAESAKIIAKYLTNILEKTFVNIKESKDSEDEQEEYKNQQLARQIEFANRLVQMMATEVDQELLQEIIHQDGKQLHSVVDPINSVYGLDPKKQLPRPETSIAVSSLFTGAVHEPSMYTELKKEIASSDRIDMLVSFIKWSGLRLIMDELIEFTQRGGNLRIITTSYMGATDAKAIQELNKLLNTQIHISYDTKRTRLHAKAYIFYRNSGFTTAYIGSSNLSNAAISSGLEWNVKITAIDQPDTMKKIRATFDSYLNSTEFEEYSAVDITRLNAALKAEKTSENTALQRFNFDINPYPFQQEILDKLEAEREVRGHYKNLVIAATGVGKTVMSALDYKLFVRQNPGKANRLLFVAHREEILKQSLFTFQMVLKDQNFGELFVGGHKPEKMDHLFMSVQTFVSQEIHKITSDDYYDYIVIDEFHHAAAPTYQKILNHYKPQILLGLTATPERMDGKSVLEYFDDRIAAEIRLPEAIDRKLLCPFQYFGVTDSVDLDSLAWSRGGYMVKDLENVYVLDKYAANLRGELILRSVEKYVTDLDLVKGLGFCASVEHAKFMAEFFNDNGVPAIYLVGSSADAERNTAKKRLENGEIRFIFVVDIYNEGVDIPAINTVLFLRPTESLTIFLQQLGRGLRLHEDKDCLTVLDFIGQANKKYNFEQKFAALTTGDGNVLGEIKNGFINLPKGCYIQMEKKATEYIVNNIKSNFGNKNALIARIATFEEDSGLDLTLANFVNYHHLDIRSIYKTNNFSRLCFLAGAGPDFVEPEEQMFTKALQKMTTIDSRRWIQFLLNFLPQAQSYQLSKEEEMLLQMTQFTIWQKSYEEAGFSSLRGGFVSLQNNPILMEEMMELLRYNYEKIDFIDHKADLPYLCPLDVHCTYSRDQLLVGLEFMKPNSVREGVKYLPNKKTGVFFITLNKSDKEYSPTTMYDDYSINEWLFHWQSQSTTGENSPVGQRYIHHQKTDNKILLFVREYKKDSHGGSQAYTFLGLADYVQHEGSKPMSITWRLQLPIPAKFLKKTNKLVVG